MIAHNQEKDHLQGISSAYSNCSKNYQEIQDSPHGKRRERIPAVSPYVTRYFLRDIKNNPIINTTDFGGWFECLPNQNIFVNCPANFTYALSL